MNTGRIVVNAHGDSFHVGGRRLPAKTAASHPHLFRAYSRYRVKVPLPVVVDNMHASAAAQSDILGNDQLGDCTVAGALHIVEALTAGGGAPAVFTEQDAVALYGLWDGYVPGDPSTDQGGDEVSIVEKWRDGGIDGKGAHAIAGSVYVDPANVQLVKQAVYEFGSLYIGGALVDAWTTSPGDGAVWDVGVQDPDDGHCVVVLGYDDYGVLVNSWGFRIRMTWPALAQFASERNGGNCFAIISREWVDGATSADPAGILWSKMVQDFDGFGGQVKA